MVYREGEWIYIRRCKRCGELFRSKTKYSKICDKCKRNKGVHYEKLIRRLEALRNERS